MRIAVIGTGGVGGGFGAALAKAGGDVTFLARGAHLAATRQNGLRDDPDVFTLFGAVMRETEAVGRARGVKLPDDVVEAHLAWLRTAPPTVMASMAHDLLRGNRIELPWLAGKIVTLGRELGVPTPANAFIHEALKPYANGAPFSPC